MTRERKQSGTGFYHAMIRGVARCPIFYDEKDSERYLALLRKYISIHNVKMHAWCLMGNHVHLLPQVENHAALVCLMHDASTAYAKYFNKRYDRVGHLFQGRFHSKPIEDEAYFLTVLRYIHQNPIGPRLSTTCNYRWSSYQDYTRESDNVITTTGMALSILGGLEAFVAFHAELGKLDDSLDPIDAVMRVSQEEAAEIARRLIGAEGLRRLTQETKPIKAAAVTTLHEEGLSYRQIAKVTGIPFGTVSSLSQ